MAITNQAVQALVDAGADAMDNMYDLKIRFPWSDNAIVITTRIDGFDPPASKTETYDKEYHGQKVKLPNTKATLDRTFDITLTFDATYNLWGQFKTWKSAVDDEVSGGKANWPGLVGDIEICALAGAYMATNSPDLIDKLQSNGDSGIKWAYSNVYVTECENPKYKTKGGDAMTYKVSFCYFGDDFAPFANGAGLNNGSGN